MQGTARASWQNPKVLTTLLLVFVAGAMAGALSMRVGLHERLHPGTATWKDPNAAKAFLDRCRTDLNLSPQQTEQMAVILDDYKSYYESVQEQLEDVRATGKNRILALLNEDQRRKFEKMVADVKK
jgi:fatty-acid desaturase